MSAWLTEQPCRQNASGFRSAPAPPEGKADPSARSRSLGACTTVSVQLVHVEIMPMGKWYNVSDSGYIMDSSDSGGSEGSGSFLSLK